MFYNELSVNKLWFSEATIPCRVRLPTYFYKTNVPLLFKSLLVELELSFQMNGLLTALFDSIFLDFK